MRSVKRFIELADPIVAAFNEWVDDFTVLNYTLTGGSGRVRGDYALAAPDHICFKCGSTKEYEHNRRVLELAGNFSHTSMISGRRISIIKLNQPFVTALGKIFVVELSDQKSDGSQKSGFDHIEVYPLEGVAMSDMARNLNLRGAMFEEKGRDHHTTWDMVLPGTKFKVRLEDEPLLDKIKRDEM